MSHVGKTLGPNVFGPTVSHCVALVFGRICMLPIAITALQKCCERVCLSPL